MDVLDEVKPHLRTALFITGAFATAWSWDLVYYGASHAAAGVSPLQDQISFADQGAPKNLLFLLLQYLLVCGGAAALSEWLRWKEKEEEERGEGRGGIVFSPGWTEAMVTAVEFFPSPVFAGKLMSYLAEFDLGTLDRALVNFAASWFAAFLAHVIPMDLCGRLTRFGEVVRATLGFGVGIAWNALISQFAPEGPSTGHYVAYVGYLAVVTLIAFRLAVAVTPSSSSDGPSVWDRQKELLSFAANVVCAFTLVSVLNLMTHPGWFGALESLAILLALSAAMSAVVARVDLDSARPEPIQSEQGDYRKSKFGRCVTCLLIGVPCVWCCCPWVPLVWLLAGTETIGVKERWFQLTAMVSGLAASIEASNMLTDAMDMVAASLGICDANQCEQRWLFVTLQVVLAVLTTAVLIPAIAPIAESSVAELSNSGCKAPEDQSLLPQHPSENPRYVSVV